MSSLENSADWRRGQMELWLGLRPQPEQRGADFSVAAHAHVPTSSLRSIVGPGASTRSRRSLEMTRGWGVEVSEFLKQR